MLNSHFSSRTISFVGCFFAALGVGLCYTATSVIEIIVYIGVVQGFGIGLTYVQNNAIINQYFIKYRATANGISLSGGAIGSFALSYLIEICLKFYTLQEIFLILSAIILITLPICLLMKPFRGNPSLDDVIKETPKILSVEDLEKDEEKDSFPETFPLPKFLPNLYEKNQENILQNEENRKVEMNRKLSTLSNKDFSFIMKNERKRIKENNEQVMKIATVYLKSYKDLNSTSGLTFTGSNTIVVPVKSGLKSWTGRGGDDFVRRESILTDISKVVANVTKKFERRVSTGCSPIKSNCDVNYNHDLRIERSDTVNSRTAVLDTSSDTFDTSFASCKSDDSTNVWKLVANILTNKMFILICMTHMALFWSSITYTMIIVDFSLDKGISIAQSVHILNSFAAGDLIGRLGSGWFMDNKIVSLKFLAFVSTTGTGLLLSVTPLFEDYYFFLTISAILGLLSGTMNILLNVLFCKYVGSSNAALAFGLSAFFCGVCTLGRPLVVGHFRDQVDGSYDGLFITLGVISMVIGSVWLFESFIRRGCKNFDHSEEEDPKTLSTESIPSIDSISIAEKV